MCDGFLSRRTGLCFTGGVMCVEWEWREWELSLTIPPKVVCDKYRV